MFESSATLPSDTFPLCKAVCDVRRVLRTALQQQDSLLLFRQRVIRFVPAALPRQLLASLIKPLLVMRPNKLVDACDTVAA